MKKSKKTALETLDRFHLDNKKLKSVGRFEASKMQGGVEVDTWDPDGMVHCDHLTEGSPIDRDLVVNPDKSFPGSHS